MTAYIRSLASKFFRPSTVASEMDEELRSHIAHRADDLERSGLSRADAERRARVEFGGRERYREESYKALGGNWLEIIRQDVRIAWRMLRKSPGFTVVAIVTLALAIGANAVVFSILNALVLRPVNVPDGGNLYQIEQAKDHIPSQSYADYVDLRDRNKSFDGLALYGIDKVGLDTNGTPSPAWIYEASANYFDALKVQPYLGRFFHAADDRGVNSAPYMVLSYAFWTNHFHGDTGIVGRAVRVNDAAYTILGVAPEGFRGTEVFYAPDFWVPIVNTESADTLKGRGNRGFWIVGHLRPGVTVAQATEDLNSVSAQMGKIYPADDNGLTFGLARPGLLGNMLGGPVHAFVMGLMLLAGLILLAACANLGSLFSARAADRWREVSLRLALGSTRGRILRQLLTEAVMVSLGGAAAGIAGSVMLLRALSVWQPIPDIPINVPVNPDGRTFAMALLLALVSGLLFGLVPVRLVMKANPYQGIKAAVGATQGMRRFTLRDLLLAVQIALCAVLVTSSLVAVRGMVRSLHSNFGFDPGNAMQVDTDLSMSGYKKDQMPAIQRRLLNAISGIPGVTAAGFADRVPLNIGWSDGFVYRDSTTNCKPENRVAEATEYRASPGYFEAAATTFWRGAPSPGTTPRVSRWWRSSMLNSRAQYSVASKTPSGTGSRSGRHSRAGRRDRGKREVQNTERRPAACDVSFHSAIAVRRYMVCGSFESRDAGTGAGIAADPQWSRYRVAVRGQYVGPRIGDRVVCGSGGIARSWCAGSAGCDARGDGDFRPGSIHGKQAAARTGNPRCVRSTEETGVAGRAWEGLQAAGDWFGGRRGIGNCGNQTALVHRVRSDSARPGCADWGGRGDGTSGAHRCVGSGDASIACGSADSAARGVMQPNQEEKRG